MKKIMFVLLLTAAAMSAMAQTTKVVTGAVIDKKTGNPLPGAKVEATGGAESTVTDADGSYTIEVSQWLKSLTATYPGMRDKKKSLKNTSNVLFELKTKPTKHWFVNLDVGIGATVDVLNSNWFFGQQRKDWGWFVKFGEERYMDDQHVGDWSALTLVGGTVKPIMREKPLYAYLGLGVGHTFGYDYGGYAIENRSCYVIDGGLMYRLGHLNLNAGMSSRDLSQTYFHLGVGYVW